MKSRPRRKIDLTAGRGIWGGEKRKLLQEEKELFPVMS